MNNNIYDSSEFGSSKKKYINYINKNKSSKSSMKNIKKGNSNYSSSKSISSKDQIKDFIQNTIKKEIIGRLNKKDKKLETIINNNIHNNYKPNINNRYKTNNTSKKNSARTGSVIRWMWRVFGIFVAALFVLFILVYNGIIGYMPPIEELKNPSDMFASTIYSADGEEMGRYYRSKGNRVYVDFDQMSRRFSAGKIFNRQSAPN